MRIGAGLVAAWAAAAAAAPSQNPLLTADSAGAKPNLVLTFDDSRSMVRRFLPDSIFASPTAAAGQLAFHPADAAGAPVRAPFNAAAAVVTTRVGDLVSARLRSASFNRLYYDPEIRYRPWANADGTLMADADPQAAHLDPLVGASFAAGMAAQLTGEQSWGAAIWCRSNPLAVANAAGESNATAATCGVLLNESVAPATYYTWNGGNVDAVSSFKRVRIMDSATFARGPARTDCSISVATATCTQAQEYQNFANWFSYHRTRLYSAIAATSTAFSAMGDTFRLGYGRFSHAASPVDGIASRTLERGVRPFTGSDRADFFSWLHRMSASGGGSPRQAMEDVGLYYSRSDGLSPWGDPPTTVQPAQHSACRRSHHLMVTDRNGNGARFAVQSGTLADVATYYFNRDLRPDLDNSIPVAGGSLPPAGRNAASWQNMVNHTAGFGAGVAGTADDLLQAALNSGGFHASLLDPAQFAGALGQILEGTGPADATQAGVEVSGRSLGAAARKFVPSYRAARWSGNLLAYAIDAQGTQGAVLWRAADEVPAPARRNIWVGRNAANGQGAVAFRLADMQAAGIAPLLGRGASNALVDYLRGDRTGEGESMGVGAGYRVRDGVLGDIVNSQPLLVRGLLDMQYNFLPAGTAGRDTYRAFVAQKAARAGAVFFGANDGMLHAVSEADGHELFAFVPAAALARMATLASPAHAHRYLVDGPLAEADAYWDGRWRNVLVGTTGAGAPAVFALDVTQTAAMDASAVLWEFNAGRDAELGSVLSAPDSGLTRGGQWVAVFGNGYGGASGKARLYVVDIKTGAVLRTLDAAAEPGNGLGGVRLLRDTANRIVAAYAGDLQGGLWRFDLSATDSTKWSVGFGGKPLFTALDAAGRPQPITAAPEHVPHPRGGTLVLAGSGKLFEDIDTADTASTQLQALYGLWDRTEGSVDSTSARRVLSPAELAVHRLGSVSVRQANSPDAATFDTVAAQPVDWAVHSGWKLPLPYGFRDIHGASLIQGLVRFKLVAPAVRANGCVATSAQAMDLQLNPRTGDMPAGPVFDTNGDGAVDSGDVRVAGVRTGAEGRGVVLVNARTGAARIAGSAARTAAMGYGRPRVPRTWRQIINFPRQE